MHARRLHALFDQLPALIGYWDRDCRNVIANAQYLEYFGQGPEEMHGMHLRDVLGPEVYAKNLPFIAGVLRGEEQLFERSLVDMSGRIRHTQASYVPDVVDGEVVGFFALVTDVTPRVEAQRALDEAQQLAALGSWTMHVETGVVTWSDELYRIFGLDPESFVPTVDAVMDRIDPRDVDRLRAQIDESITGGADYDLSYRVLAGEGRVRDIHSQGHADRDADGNVVRLAGTLQDVTASNAAARELTRANSELRKVNELNADVLAMLGHDVRAPLSVVLGYLEELTDEWEDLPDARRREHLDRVSGAASRMRDLIDDILAMATVDSGDIVARLVVLNALDPVRDAVAGVAGQSDLDITVTAVGRPHVLADPFHVRQVVANLVTNAIRYGAPPIEVLVEARDTTTVAITVSDHGTGVPNDQVPMLFERFAGRESAEASASAGGTSTGFGLYIARGLAVANHGSLAYEGGESGARFCLTLPRAPAPELDAPAEQDRPVPFTARPTVHRMDDAAP